MNEQTRVIERQRERPIRWSLWCQIMTAALVLVVGVWSCGQPPQTEPNDVDPRVAFLAGEFGEAGGTFEGDFGEVPALQYRYPAPAGARVTIELTRLSGTAEPLLKIYGPRNGEVPGPLVARDDDGSAGSRQLAVGPLAEGMYVVVVSTRDWPTSGRFRLTIDCTEGCPEMPECPPVLSCPTDQVCHTGYEFTEDGCPTCTCRDECREDLECGPEEACRQGLCEERCACPVPLDPVCGTDGVSYANSCEAGCAGVAVVSEGECPEVCPELTCDLGCPSGYRLGSDGCEICECKEPCEACDLLVEPVCTLNGQTRQNACLAECRGEQVAYAGACRPECPDLACDVECTGGYVRDNEGCLTCECLEVSCPEVLDPVCGANGVTYNNECEAEAAGVEVLFKSACPPRCQSVEDCPTNYSCNNRFLGLTPCDISDETCVAFCFLNEISCETERACPSGDTCSADALCDSPCDCAPVYDPVCGANGVDYDNACRARCAETVVSSTSTCCDPNVIASCDLECVNGYAVDSNGCEVCTCAVPTTCVCSDVYNPVCGADGVEYANECRMRCEGAGACSAGAVISASRICGADGKLYGAECFMQCAGVRRCETPTDVSNADMICGEDGRLYANECAMQCADVRRATDATICLRSDGD